MNLRPPCPLSMRPPPIIDSIPSKPLIGAMISSKRRSNNPAIAPIGSSKNLRTPSNIILNKSRSALNIPAAIVKGSCISALIIIFAASKRIGGNISKISGTKTFKPLAIPSKVALNSSFISSGSFCPRSDKAPTTPAIAVPTGPNAPPTAPIKACGSIDAVITVSATPIAFAIFFFFSASLSLSARALTAASASAVLIPS